MASTSLTLNRARYAGADYNTIYDELLTRAQVNYAEDFTDFALSSLGVMLLDLVAYGIEGLSFYLDRRASDFYLSTCRTKKAASKLARQVGYKVRSAISASVDLQVSLTAVPAVDVVIPKGFRFKGPKGLEFEAARDVTFPAGSPTTLVKDVPCIEGETVTESFVSDGATFQTFELHPPTGKLVTSGSITVTVNGSPWTESEFLSFTASDQYEIDYGGDPPLLRFGDGVLGNIPTSGASISISYHACSGKNGQADRNTITKESSSLVVNFQTVGMVINNARPAVGGDDTETIQSIKANAGKLFKARSVAITRQDYETIASSFADPLFGKVAVAQAISARSADSDIELLNQLNTITAEVTSLSSTVTPVLSGPTTVVGTASLTAGAALSGLTLVLTLASGSRVTTTFAGSNPISKTSIVNQINASVGYTIASLNVIDNLVLSDTRLTIEPASTALIILGISSIVSANAKLGAITTSLSTMESDIADIASNVSDMDSQIGSAVTSLRTARNQIQEITNDISNIQTLVTTGKDAVDAIAPGVSDSLTTATADALKAYFDSINAEATSISGNNSSVDGVASTLISALGTVRNTAIDIGISVTLTSPPPDLVSKVEQSRAAVVSQVGDTTPTGLYKDISDAQQAVDDLDEAVIDGAVVAIKDHMDEVLSDDCKANLVVVPILTRNADGFYSGPTVGLVQALQSYLDTKKEETQTVSVTSGENFLIYPVLRIRADIKNVTESVARTAISAAVDGVLKDRKFGVDLRESELMTAVLSVTGVVAANIDILGHAINLDLVNNTFTIDTTKLDSDGNLVIPKSEVVTKAPVPVTITINIVQYSE